MRTNRALAKKVKTVLEININRSSSAARTEDTGDLKTCSEFYQ